MAISEIFLPFGASPVAENVEIAHGDLINNMNNCTLTPGTVYYIINRPGGPVYVHAITNCTLAPTAYRGQLCPAVYDVTTDTYGNVWKGVWRPELTDAEINVGDLVIWGHAVWKNLTGNKGTSVDDYALDVTNWQLIPRSSFTNHEYVELFFEISYDAKNDWIAKQYDGNGNVIGLDFSAIGLFADPSRNPCDYTDWNMGTSTTAFFSNEVRQVLNNFQPMGIWNNKGGEIINNRCGGGINDNITEWGIKGNRTGQQIEFNISLAIDDNTCGGSIMFNLTPSNAIQENTNTGHINNNVTHMIVANRTPCTDVNNNVVPDGIYSNENAGKIANNVITGDISYNTIVGDITHNRNNGDIRNNSSSVACNITKNNNNGDIAAQTRTGDVSDAIVNK